MTNNKNRLVNCIQPISKFVTIFLSCILICALTSCTGNVHLTTGFNEDEFMKVSGNTIPMSLVKVLLAEERNNYTNVFGEDIWDISLDDDSLVNEIKRNIKYKLSELVIISMLAKEKGIALSKSEKDNIEKASKAYLSGISEDERASLGITWQDINQLYEYFLLTIKLYELSSEGQTIEISDEDARVMKIQYCFVKKTNETNSKAYYKISQVHKELIEGKSFGVVAKEYSDDESFECEIGRDSFGNGFDEVVFELENGQISDIIETDNGYYVVKCLNSYNEEKTKENKKVLLEKYREKQFKEMYEPYIDKFLYEYNDKAYNDIDIKTLVLDNNDLYSVFETYISTNE